MLNTSGYFAQAYRKKYRIEKIQTQDIPDNSKSVSFDVKNLLPSNQEKKTVTIITLQR